MKTVSLSRLARLASAAKYPTDKTTLRLRLLKEGVRAKEGIVEKGQKGLLYEVEKLPLVLRSAVIAAQEHEAAEAHRRYIAAPKSLRDDAERRAAMCRRYFEERREGAKESAARRAAADAFGVTPATVKNALKLIDSLVEADWLPALVKDYRGRQKSEIHPEIWRYFVSDYGRAERPQAQAVYERTCQFAQQKGYGPIPSKKTLERRWNDIPAHARTLMRDGEKAARAALVKAERDRSQMVSLDQINMDGRIWDIRVRDGDREYRPVVTIAQDSATNFILAYTIAETESTQSYRRTLLSAFTRYGIPKSILFDNTLSAANKAITGGAKNRYRYKSHPDDVAGLLKRLSCEPHFAQPENPQSKLVERANLDLKERSEKHPHCKGSYCGKSPVDKPANYGESAVAIAVFRRVLAAAVDHYNTRTDRRSKIAVGTSYQAVFEEGLKHVAVRKLADWQRDQFFRDGVKRTVSPAGEVRIGKRPFDNRFQSEKLREYAGKEIVVWYDPDDLTAPIRAETVDGRMIDDRVPLIEKRGFNNADDAREHGRQKKIAMRATKQTVAALNRMSALELQAASPLPEPVEPTPPDTPLIAPTFQHKPKPVRNSGLDVEGLADVIEEMKRFRLAAGQ